MKRRIGRAVEHAFDGALRERREKRQLFDKGVGRFRQRVVRHAIERDAPGGGVLAGQAARAHHHVLGARDADHMQQADRAARARDHADALLGQTKTGRFGDDAKIAGERQLERDAEAEPLDGGNHGLSAALGRRDIFRELRHMFGRALHEARNVAAARKILAFRAEHDNAHIVVTVERREHRRELLALRHADDVERRPVENDVGPCAVYFHAEAVEVLKHGLVCLAHGGPQSCSYSPAISLRRKILPTGDFGMALTKT